MVLANTIAVQLYEQEQMLLQTKHLLKQLPRESELTQILGSQLIVLCFMGCRGNFVIDAR